MKSPRPNSGEQAMKSGHPVLLHRMRKMGLDSWEFHVGAGVHLYAPNRYLIDHRRAKALEPCASTVATLIRSEHSRQAGSCLRELYPAAARQPLPNLDGSS
jgi:hypothetical protein